MNEKMEYQQFMSKNKIKTEDLPPVLGLLVEEMDKQLTKAKESCDSEDCEKVFNKLKKYNDFILSEMYELYEDKLNNNDILPDLPKKKAVLKSENSPKRKLNSDEQILADFLKRDKDVVTQEELIEAGFQEELKERFVVVGQYVLKFFPSASIWLIEYNFFHND